MKKMGLIFWHEYWNHLTRRGYLIFTFGFPIFIIVGPLIGGVILAILVAIAAPKSSPLPVGVVDQVGLLTSPVDQRIIQQKGFMVKDDIASLLGDSDLSTEVINSPISVIFIRTPEEAAAALATHKIQAYYTLPPDYWDTGNIYLSYYNDPNEIIRNLMHGWVQLKLNQDIPPEILERYYSGPDISHTNLAEDTRDFSIITLIEGGIVYMVIYFVRLVGTSFTANYMFDSIASEADDRTLEILITSVSPLQFLLGKLFGLISVGLTQLLIWGSLGLIVIQSISLITATNLLGYILAWPYLSLLVSMLMGAYIMDHLLAAALGLFKVSGGAGMQLFSLMNLFSGFSILYATYFIPRNPHTFFAIFASFFPLTSPVVLLIRVIVSEVPLWQTIIGQLFLWSSNIIALIWLHRLLKANLVANRTPFSLRDWLKQAWKRRRGTALS